MSGFNKEELGIERVVLLCFKNGELVWPVDCYGLSESAIKKLLQTLKKKQMVKGSGPYRLTKKGLRYYKEWRQQ